MYIFHDIGCFIIAYVDRLWLLKLLYPANSKIAPVNNEGVRRAVFAGKLHNFDLQTGLKRDQGTPDLSAMAFVAKYEIKIS